MASRRWDGAGVWEAGKRGCSLGAAAALKGALGRSWREGSSTEIPIGSQRLLAGACLGSEGETMNCPEIQEPVLFAETPDNPCGATRLQEAPVS